MSYTPILIVADSRGRLLKEQLDQYFEQSQYSLYWKKGLRLSDTADLVSPIILSLKPKLIYLMNGICDITYIRTREPWTVALRSLNIPTIINNYMSTLDMTYSQIYSLNSRLGYKPMILPVTQTGLDFGRYNNYPDELLSPEQRILDGALDQINRNIITLHKSMGLSPPILASAVHMRCRGKVRFARDKLEDGCHPTKDLCRVWARRLHNNARLNLEAFDHYSLVNQMYG